MTMTMTITPDMTQAENAARVNKPADELLALVLGGNAVFTLVSKKTGARYTYKVTAATDTKGMFFAKVLIGADNWRNYAYIGFIKAGQTGLIAGKKGDPRKAYFKGLDWFLRQLAAGADVEEQVEFWHVGKCVRCGRRLTVPSSIETGLGPECAKKEL